MEKLLFTLSGVFGFSAVALGAFGAHGLKTLFKDTADVEQRLAWWQTAAQYHLIHALAIALAAHLASKTGATSASVAGYCFAGGILLFSGSLYAMTLSGIRVLGAVTPLGGLSLLAGWMALIATARNLP